MAGRISAAAYPLLAIGCAALILFTIAAAIVLGLIPLYLPSKSVTLASISTFQKQLSYSIEVSDTTPTGNLSASELAELTATLQSSQTDATNGFGDLTVLSGRVVSSDSRKRRQATKILIIIILITGRTNSILILIENHLGSYIQRNTVSIAVLVVSIINSRTTTTTTISPVIISTTTVPSRIISTTMVGRRRRRQVYEESSTLALVTYKD